MFTERNGMQSRGLVSGIYRMALPNSHSKLEEDLRLKATLRRLVAKLGLEKVADRIRAYPVATKDDQVRKTFLVFSAEAEDRRATRHVAMSV